MLPIRWDPTLACVCPKKSYLLNSPPKSLTPAPYASGQPGRWDLDPLVLGPNQNRRWRRHAPAAAGMECCRYANPFRLCSGLRVIGYLMIVLMAALAALTYYAVVVVAWGPSLLAGSPLAFLVVIAFHILVKFWFFSEIRVLECLQVRNLHLVILAVIYK